MAHGFYTLRTWHRDPRDLTVMFLVTVAVSVTTSSVLSMVYLTDISLSANPALLRV